MADLVILQGSDTTVSIPVEDANGDPVASFGGYTAAGQIRARVESSDVLHSFTSQGGSANITLTPPNVILSISAAASAAWTWTYGRYDVELTGPDGTARIASGHVIVSREVTR